jgi:hypothetical protein
LSIIPRSLATDWPEKYPDGKEDGLEDKIKKTTKPPKNFGDFFFEKFGDLDEFLAAMFF